MPAKKTPVFSKPFRSKLAREIVKGGIIIAPRRAGKTIAALNVLSVDSNMVYSCFSKEIAICVQCTAREMGFSEGVLKRIKGPLSRDQIRGVYKDRSIILDEFFWHPEAMGIMRMPQFHAALSSPGHNLRVTDGKKWFKLDCQ